MASLSPAERMKGESCKQPTEIEVLACNWTAVQVFQRCQITTVASMSGAVLLGVSASEAMAGARMLRVPVAEWPDLIDGVQMLAGHVANIENAKMKAKAEAESRKG